MAHEANAEPEPIRRDAWQALGVMTLVLVMAAQAGQAASSTVLGVVSACIVMMTLVAGTLFLFEGRLDETKADALRLFCPPAIILLGFSEALLVAGGFLGGAVLVLGLAFVASGYRRLAEAGAFNLVPAAGRDLGLFAGLGAALAGCLLAAIALLGSVPA